MITMQCMTCHAKVKMPNGCETYRTYCPKCRGMLVGPKTPGGRRLRAIKISKTIRDVFVAMIVVVLGMLNAKYSNDAFQGTLAQRLLGPLTPGVLTCVLLAWLHRYLAYLCCMVIGESTVYSREDPSVKERATWIVGAIAIATSIYFLSKSNVWPFVPVYEYLKNWYSSDVAVGTALIMFLVQRHFSYSEDFLSKIRWIRERSSDQCTGIPMRREITECYSLCILLTFTGVFIACGPDWFAGTKFGDGIGAVRGFFEALYGLFGGLAKLLVGLVVGIISFALSLFS